MSVLIANELAKSYGALDVFDGVSVRVEQGDRVGLVGPNGQGKTSLLRILAGIDHPSLGTVARARGLRMGYLPQDPPPPGERTLYADLLEVFTDLRAQGEVLRGLERQMEETSDDAELERLLEKYGQMQTRFELAGGYHYELRIRQVLSGLGFDASEYQQPLAHLSGGQRTRALLARLLLEEPDLLFLDEPTNHLDLEAVEWLEETLLQWKGALVIVAHDRYFLDKVVVRIWELANSHLEAYRGNYSHYVIQREEKLENQRRLWEKQQEHILVTEDFIRRNLAGQRAREAQGRLRRLERFKDDEVIDRPREQRRIRLNITTQIRSGDLVLATKDLTVGYERNLPLFDCPDLEVRRGQTVALIGPNGVGKTTFLKTVLGDIPPLVGRVRFGASVEPGYLAQTQAGLDPQQTVIEALLAVAPRMSTEEARRFLGRFLFSGDDVFQTISTLSGGQRSRVALARLSLRGANFLVLDEPTNHLDLESQEILQDVLLQFPGTILLVTHDRYLVEALATHIWDLRAGGLRAYEGGYSAYVAQRAAERETTPAVAITQASGSAQDMRQRMRDERRERQVQRRQAERTAAMEDEIHALEQELARLGAAIDEAGREQALAQVQRLGQEYVATEQKLHHLMEQWAAVA
jgi:ATP-binding cassette subfamily F protein 3